MTKDDIIRMAREAGLITSYGGRETASDELLERFAALVVAYKHRSFANKIKALTLDYKSDDYYQGWIDMRNAAEAVIRAEKQV